MSLAMPAEMIMEVSKKIARAWKAAMDKNKDKVVLLCDSRLRAPLAAMLSRTVPPMPVIAYDEIILAMDIESLETISLQQTEQTPSKENELVGVSK